MLIVYIIKGTDFKPYTREIVSLEEYCAKINNGYDWSSEYKDKGYVEIFETTINFDNLGYWSFEHDLCNISVPKATEKMRAVLEELKSKGFFTAIPDPDNDNWFFGQKKQLTRIFCTEPLPDNEKIPILMYHLTEVLKIAEKYDENYYFFTSY